MSSRPLTPPPPLGDPGWERPEPRRRRAGPFALGLALTLLAGFLLAPDRPAPTSGLVVDAAPSDAPAPRPARSPAPSPAVVSSRWRTLTPAPLSERGDHTGVWTGREMIVWGGFGRVDTDVPFLAGASYDLASDRWRRLPRAPIGHASGHTAVWTGEEMLVWGGRDPQRRLLRRGAAWEPFERTWRRLPEPPVAPRADHVAVWTGREMVVWGGAGPTASGDGAAYDPRTDRWRRIAAGPLAPRFGATAVWTGREMLVWGGATEDLDYETPPLGAAYDPRADRWRTLPNGPLVGRLAHTAVWTGDEMLVWGGAALGRVPGAYADGAAYDPVADRWRPLSAAQGLARRLGHSAVWTGNEMVVWGGVDREFHRDGGAYQPASDRWRLLSPAPLDSPSRYSAVWTGGAMLLWGGGFRPMGAVYRPLVGLRVRRLNAPFPR